MRMDLNKLLMNLTNKELEHEDVVYALNLRKSNEIGNVKKFFNLYKEGRHMCANLIDCFIDRLRIRALQILTKGFGEKSSITWISEMLAFKNEEECRKFLKETDAVLTEDGECLANKESYKVYADHPWLQRKIITKMHI
eukprot:CAMPEP_0176414136 /NCGR_PEP_ID=MMETSP0127-20121128/5093_1 /TAXON_ID=938130 /ORGANISM="Platyophrya macrostoma, Strain WH" /LENGTH=138 /DNA_ID=CAMNT_0017794007 /DNA_START=499 /DNA_END=915 /DNA_ORIENTATION=+